ncbi:MAG: DUF5667 domain-containing protein [Anaerolineales bacterium]|jgi:hypothetical protein
MNHKFESILDECLERIAAGARLEECLEQHPQHAEELRPLLTAANFARTAPRPQASPEAIQHSRVKMLATLESKLNPQPVSKISFSRFTSRLTKFFTGIGKEKMNMKLTTRFAIIILALFVIISGGATAASARSLPGDVLYPVKTTVERVQLLLTTDPDARHALEQRFQGMRWDEIKAVLEDGRSVEIELKGIVTALDENSIAIGDFVFSLEDIQIPSVVQVGSVVEIKGVTQADGTIIVLKISLEDDFLPSEPELEIEDDDLDDDIDDDSDDDMDDDSDDDMDDDSDDDIDDNSDEDFDDDSDDDIDDDSDKDRDDDSDESSGDDSDDSIGDDSDDSDSGSSDDSDDSSDDDSGDDSDDDSDDDDDDDDD